MLHHSHHPPAFFVDFHAELPVLPLSDPLCPPNIAMVMAFHRGALMVDQAFTYTTSFNSVRYTYCHNPILQRKKLSPREVK